MMTPLEQIARFVWMLDMCELNGWKHLAEFIQGLLDKMMEGMTEA